MALTDAQQLEYDVFLRNNPGDQGRASEALGFDTTGAQVRSANNDPGNWDVSAARGDEAPGVQTMIDRDSGSWERQLREEAARKGVAYDPSDLGGVVRAVSHSSNVGKDPLEFLKQQYGIYATRGGSTSHRPFDSQTTDPAQLAANAAADARGRAGTTSTTSTAGTGGAPGGTRTTSSGIGTEGGGSYAGFVDGFGAAPEPFGETYTSLARPSYLQGEYVPGQWNEQFAAPEKPGVLQAPYRAPDRPDLLNTPYALPTQAELEASPGYLASQSAMQRGMERSAAAKGTVLSGGFVGRTLPRAMGEYAGTAYGNLVNQTLGARQQTANEYNDTFGQSLGARQQQFGEYSTDVSNAFQQYQQRYGQFADAEGLKLGARNVNETAFQGDQGSHLAGYSTRYGQYLDQNAAKRQSEVDLWNRERDVSDLSLRAAALARPY